MGAAPPPNRRLASPTVDGEAPVEIGLCSGLLEVAAEDTVTPWPDDMDARLLSDDVTSADEWLLLLLLWLFTITLFCGEDNCLCSWINSLICNQLLLR